MLLLKDFFKRMISRDPLLALASYFFMAYAWGYVTAIGIFGVLIMFFILLEISYLRMVIGKIIIKEKYKQMGFI